MPNGRVRQSVRPSTRSEADKVPNGRVRQSVRPSTRSEADKVPNGRVTIMPTEEIKFCQEILKEVSRSFALTIPMLDDELYKPVMIAYLQDRLLDNFEDEIENIALQERRELMDRVVNIFNPENDNPSPDIKIIKDYYPLIRGDSLKKLTKNTDILYRAFRNLDLNIQILSYKWLKAMNNGMKKYLSKDVEKFSELDEYCYYVAGTVGGFLTELIIYKSKILPEEKKNLLNNYRDAGLFLQKVNIIRDIKLDIKKRKKNYWPLAELGMFASELLAPENRDKALFCLKEMIADVKEHLPGLKIYMNSLPTCFPGYRKFFSVNNALALATLKKMKNNPDVLYGKKIVKVSRIKFLKILKAPEKCFYQLSKNV